MNADDFIAEITHHPRPTGPIEGVELDGCELQGHDLSLLTLPALCCVDSTLSMIDFRGSTLTGARFVRSTFSSVSFRETELTGAVLENISSGTVSFQSALLRNTQLCDALLFDGCSLRQAEIRHAAIRACTIVDADATGSVWEEVTLERTSFGACDLRGARFSRCEMNRVSMNETHLAGATFSDVTFRDCDIPDKCLAEADLVGCRFETT